MSIGAEIGKIRENPAVKKARTIEEAIEEKLNYDGRFDVIHPLEGVLRLSRLTWSQSDFYGARMGFDKPYFRGVDWGNVPTTMLCCAVMGDLSIEDLQAIYPAPAVTATEERENQP